MDDLIFSYADPSASVGKRKLIKLIEALLHHHRLQYEYEKPLQ